jgi:DNA polymerase III epsilon subunit-like protein
MSGNHFVAFDLETTGLDPVNDYILTAAVAGLPGGDVYLVFNPGVSIPAEAAAVNGLTDAYVAEYGVDYSFGLARLGGLLQSAWNSGATIVGHNICDFDLPMLRMQERAVFGSVRTEFGPVLDTMREFRQQYPGVSSRLGNACTHLGVTLDNAHNAQADARASWELAHVLAAAWAAEGSA